jgi:hypothetical protein
MHRLGNAVSTSHQFGIRSRNAIVDCTIAESERYGIYYNFGEHVAILGNTFDDVNAEHLIRCYLTHSVIGHNVFRGGHRSKHQLKFCGYHPPGSSERAKGTTTEAVEHVMISDNRFENPGPIQWMVTIGPVDQTKDQRIENVIFERNHMRAGSNTAVMVYANDRFNTIRNNVFDLSGSERGGTAIRIARRGVEPPPVGYSVFHNTVFRSETGEATLVEIDASARDTRVKNNLICAPGGRIVDGGGEKLSEGRNVLLKSPSFRDSAAGDFELVSGSPAIDAGDELPSVFRDFHGRLRREHRENKTARADAGAFEFQGN